MLKVKCVLKCAAGAWPEHWELTAPRSDLLPKPIQGRDFTAARQDTAGQQPAAPEVFLCIHGGGFALVTCVIHQASGGWIRQSDVAR